jgi:hypothetical protein
MLCTETVPDFHAGKGPGKIQNVPFVPIHIILAMGGARCRAQQDQGPHDVIAGNEAQSFSYQDFLALYTAPCSLVLAFCVYLAAHHQGSKKKDHTPALYTPCPVVCAGMGRRVTRCSTASLVDS